MRAALAFAAGEAALLLRGRAFLQPAPLQPDQAEPEELRECFSALLREAGVRSVRAVLALPAITAPCKGVLEAPPEKDWAQKAAHELLPEADAVILQARGGRGAPWWVCAAPREGLRRILEAAASSRMHVEAAEPASLSLLRLAPPSQQPVLVAAVSASGAEIAAGRTGAPLLARSVRARKAEDAAAEVELTARYLERELGVLPGAVLVGPAAEAAAESLRAAGISPAVVLPAGSAAEAVALGAARRPRKAPDFARTLRGPAFGAVHAAAAASAALLAASVFHATSQGSRVEALRRQVSALEAERQVVQAQLARWTGPRAQAARQALQALQARKLPLEALDQLRDLVPADLWAERVEMRAGAIRIEGRSLSRDSVLSFAQRARAVWKDVRLRLAEREEEPAPSFKFQLEAVLPPARHGREP